MHAALWMTLPAPAVVYAGAGAQNHKYFVTEYPFPRFIRSLPSALDSPKLLPSTASICMWCRSSSACTSGALAGRSRISRDAFGFQITDVGFEMFDG